MFYGQCWKCGERWELGTASACKCPDEEPVKFAFRENNDSTEILRVTPEGEFIWHEDADRMIEEGDFSQSPALPHILKVLRKQRHEQEPVAWMYPEGLEALKAGKPWTAYGTRQEPNNTALYLSSQPDIPPYIPPYAWVTFTPYGDEDDVWYENPEGRLLEGWTYKPLYDTTPPQRTLIGLMRGVRVEGDTVVISVKGGNDAARELCGELINEMNK